MNKQRSTPDYPAESIIRRFQEAHVDPGAPAALAPAGVRRFRAIIYGYYKKYRREYPWRETADPYHILVSEVMLQQTQTDRVGEIFRRFIELFPTVRSLADAPFNEVLAAWQGLGYNRRALNLHRLAKQVADEAGGIIPSGEEELDALPGIGAATAAAIRAYAFGEPAVYIETNIRTLYIHFFFPGKEEVADQDLLPLVELTLDRADPRAWYSALMDYGGMLKRRFPNPGRKSAHYQRQSKFEGSRRQLRGMILRSLVDGRALTAARIARLLDAGERASLVGELLEELRREGLVRKEGRSWRV